MAKRQKSTVEDKNIGLVLAGGLSKRLFPFGKPKPLLEVGGQSLLENALDRLKDVDEVFVVTNKKVATEIVRFFKAKRKSPPQFILEPEPRDTAAAVGFALRDRRIPTSANVVIVSADHYIPAIKEFRKFLSNVLKEISNYPDALFVAGSLPEHKPQDTYCQLGWMTLHQLGSGASQGVNSFIEKPDGRRIQELLEMNALVNCGMFFGKAETFRGAFQEYFPEVLNRKIPFKQLKREPIDRAIIEKFARVRAFTFKLKWEDLGTWTSIAKELGSREIQEVRSSQNFFWSSDKTEELYVFGLDRLAVIRFENRILVMRLEEAGNMKAYLDQLRGADNQ